MQDHGPKSLSKKPQHAVKGESSSVRPGRPQPEPIQEDLVLEHPPRPKEDRWYEIFSTSVGLFAQRLHVWDEFFDQAAAGGIIIPDLVEKLPPVEKLPDPSERPVYTKSTRESFNAGANISARSRSAAWWTAVQEDLKAWEKTDEGHTLAFMEEITSKHWKHVHPNIKQEVEERDPHKLHGIGTLDDTLAWCINLRKWLEIKAKAYKEDHKWVKDKWVKELLTRKEEWCALEKDWLAFDKEQKKREGKRSVNKNEQSVRKETRLVTRKEWMARVKGRPPTTSKLTAFLR